MHKVLSRLKYYAAVASFLLTSSILTAGPAMLSGRAFANGAVNWTGQGTTNGALNTVDCTGDTATPGTLLWVFSLGGGTNTVTSATLALGGSGSGTYSMNPTGNEMKAVTPYFNLSTLTASVNYVGSLGNGASNLVISHGCLATSVTPAEVTFNDVCGTDGDTFTVPTTTGVNYQVGGVTVSAGSHAGTGSVTVTAVAQTGYTLTGATSWSHTFNSDPCEVPLTPVTPAEVTFNDVCGTDGDTFTVPTTTGVNYSVAAGTHAGSDTVTVTATAQTGYVLTGTASWSHTFTNDACDVCPNLPDVQASVPKGYKLVDGTCQPKKVYVCKYVGTPGVDERLQTGQNPIDVSVNSIDVDPVVVGSTFSDAQSHSVVIAFDEGQTPPTAEDCVTPHNQPTVVATPSACVPPSVLPTGSLTVTVTNPNTYEVTYTLTVGLASQDITLAAGAHGDVTFNSLAAGTYTANVSGDDDTSGSASATIVACPVGGSGGHVLGASTAVLTDTGVSVLLPTILAISLAITATGIMFGNRKFRNQIAVNKNIVA